MTTHSETLPTGSPSSAGGSASTTDAAKDQAAGVARGAAQAGQHVADDVRQEVGAVADEARRQARHLLDDARVQLQDQADTQQVRLASGLRTFSDQLDRLTSDTQESGVAVDLAREVASRVGGYASWLESRNTADVLDEVRWFARRRPGTFLLVAVGAGLVVGRLARSLKDAPAQPRTVDTGRTSTLASTPTYASGAAVRPADSAWTTDTDLPSGVGTTGVTPGLGTSTGTGAYSTSTSGYGDTASSEGSVLPDTTTDPYATRSDAEDRP